MFYMPTFVSLDTHETTQKEKKEEKKEEKVKATKVGRRLSARVGDLFKPRHKEPAVPAKVPEVDQPPKIEEPAPVAPLENPAAEEPAAEAPAPAAEEPKPEAPAAPVAASA